MSQAEKPQDVMRTRVIFVPKGWDLGVYQNDKEKTIKERLGCTIRIRSCY